MREPGGPMGVIRRIEYALLAALLRRVDARRLGREHLLLMVDSLSSALAVADSPPDLREEFLRR